MKKIKMTLDPKSLQAAIKEVEQYKKDFEKKVNYALHLIVEKGVEIAKELVPVDFGDLRESIEGRVENNKGYVYTTMYYAPFVEFGFGVVGARNPHPEISINYDVNNHGDDGWIYFDNKRCEFRWSKGQPSKPFMWNTARQLEEIKNDIVKEVFNK